MVTLTHRLLNPTLKFKFRPFAFEPRVRIHLENRKYVIKTADHYAEVLEALSLRHDVFIREAGGWGFGLDWDRYDQVCDHLVILDKKSKRVVGTYRMLCTLFNDDFYSQSEFSMQGILDLPGVKLELGRAAIHSAARNGATIQLLWRGIAEYARKTRARYLFGCSSIKTLDPRKARAVDEHFKDQGMWSEEFGCAPLDAFDWNQGELHDYLGTPDNLDGVEIPGLIRFYMKFGAKMCGRPAVDRDFRCIDYLTLLDLQTMEDRMASRFRDR